MVDQKELESVLEEFKKENSQMQLINLLKAFLVSEMEKLPTEDSDANEHKLNMILRDLEEDLDTIETEKLSDWDPEQQ